MPDVAQLAFLPHSVGPYATLVVIGFAIGIGGHLFRARWLVIAGIILIFLGAFLFPLALSITGDNRTPPVETSP